MYTGKKQRAAVTLYNRARKLFVAGKHAKSAAMFQTFLRKYFDHEFADNALYWLGETAYVQHNWLQALSWFQDVVIRYPEGNKLGDAMLKSALCYAKLGDPSYAIKVLTDVESLFPGKRIAAIARAALGKLVRHLGFDRRGIGCVVVARGQREGAPDDGGRRAHRHYSPGVHAS